ncbi:MAG: hypothetical protein HY652_13420 [Acidobacteria bacterium]|nr:hypothetical protein [Acidobacteriota bacterium]
MRVIEGPKTRLARTTHAIVFDEVHDEIVAPNPFAEAILFYRGGASGDEAPVRIIQGPHTSLDSSDELALDTKNNEVIVPLNHAILFFPREGNGDVAPLRMIAGPKTQLDTARGIAVDPVNNIIAVGNGTPRAILIFNRTDQGDVAPRAIITGPKTGIHATKGFWVNPERKEVIAAIEAPRVQQTREVGSSFVGIWNYTDNGDVPPKALIKGRDTMLIAPRGVALNPKNKEMYIIDKMQNALFAFHWPEIF